MSPGWDRWDYTNVPVLAVERIRVAWGAKTLPGAVRKDGRWAQDGWGEICWFLGLRLGWYSWETSRRLSGGSWALSGLLWPRPLCEHCPQ